jgi:transposase-like protein
MNIARATELYQHKGRSLQAIADEMGCTPKKIKRGLRAAGVTIGPQGRNRSVTDEYVILALKMRAQGLDWDVVASKIGFSASALKRSASQHATNAFLAREAALQALLNAKDQEIDNLRTQLALLGGDE